MGHLFQNSRPLFIGLGVENFNMFCEMDESFTAILFVHGQSYIMYVCNTSRSTLVFGNLGRISKARRIVVIMIATHI